MYEVAFSIRETLLDEFRFDQPLVPHVEDVLSNIKAENSVSIHVRRGEYCTLRWWNGLGSVCSLQYFKNAVGYFEDNYSNLKYFIFSDDKEYVKDNFRWLKNSVIVDIPDNTMCDYYDLFLMSECRHNIIANSTFSWWAAFLNKNPNKKVVVPFGKFSGDWITADEICPPDWIRVLTTVPPYIAKL
jgi:hypothetical protein